jgi:hypothetical protein
MENPKIEDMMNVGSEPMYKHGSVLSSMVIFIRQAQQG